MGCAGSRDDGACWPYALPASVGHMDLRLWVHRADCGDPQVYVHMAD